MKNAYSVAIKVADRLMLADLLDAIGPYAQSAEITVINGAPKAVTAPAPKAAPKLTGMIRRGPKRSKVNEAIRNAVSGGKASIAALKIALEEAGMSPASLSTGIAALTKSGEIERVGDGEYARKAA